MVKRSIEEEIILDWDMVHVFYCPICGKRIADWWRTLSVKSYDKDPRINPCRHLLFVYYWNTNEFLYIRSDLKEKLESKNINIDNPEIYNNENEDILVVLKREALEGSNFAVFTLYSQPAPMAETMAVSVGIDFNDESGYDHIAQEASSYINKYILIYLRKAVYNGEVPGNVREAVDRAIRWVLDNVKYNNECKHIYKTFIYNVIYTVKRGHGSCWEIAFLLAAILLSAGLRQVYILNFENSKTKNNSVVVALELDGKLLVIDYGRNGVFEWNEYFSSINLLYDVRVFKLSLTEGGMVSVDYCRIDKSMVLDGRCSPLCACR